MGGVPIESETRRIWTNAVDDYAPPALAEYGRATKAGEKSFRDFKATLWRWRDDFQNDFAARIDWTTKSFEEANLGRRGIEWELTAGTPPPASKTAASKTAASQT